MYCIDSLKTNDIPEIEKILDQAFGIDRHEKTAYRLRDGVSAIGELSFVGRINDTIKASLQFWPVVIRDGQEDRDAILLGPIAVCDDCRGLGYGLRLMEHGLNIAAQLGHKRVILVGDEAYYKKVGFSRRLARGLEMPGPVDSDRLLARELVPGSLMAVKGVISKIK
ncbi:hypothetical protein MNBD_ALPHA01-1760 [hydrothermal vent metagenome]|uniref:N-acetyltransferase domain-containing protein n=1 Tax=hydrothermal vent metagenome TaxID=652676 RepID=A0A3B0SEW0_9ZZZZ